MERCVTAFPGRSLRAGVLGWSFLRIAAGGPIRLYQPLHQVAIPTRAPRLPSRQATHRRVSPHVVTPCLALGRGGLRRLGTPLGVTRPRGHGSTRPGTHRRVARGRRVAGWQRGANRYVASRLNPLDPLTCRLKRQAHPAHRLDQGRTTRPDGQLDHTVLTSRVLSLQLRNVVE